MAENFWSARFDEWADDDGQVALNKLTDDHMAALRKRVRKGELPDGYITTNPTTALNTLNRLEVEHAYIRWRRHAEGLSLRAYVSRQAFDPTQVGVWVKTADDPEAAKAYAQQRLQAEVATSITLHGAALVQMAGWSWGQVAAAAHTEVDRAVARMQETEARREEAAKRKAA